MSDTSYEHGVFCWVDLSTLDVEAAIRWYGELFGWEFLPSEDPNMPYSMATQAGKLVAGVGQLPPDMQANGVPPMWNNFAYVDDCAKTEAAAIAAGATVIAPTMQVGEFGSMAFLQDPTGGVIGLWQPNKMHGAELTNQPNSLCWNELMTPDVDAAKAFYAKTLGWTYESMPMGDFDYTLANVGARQTAGMVPMDGPMWEGIPPHWMVYFAVADTDAIASKVEATGGTVSVPPTDIPIGRFAVLRDPQGAMFSVITLAAPPA